MNTRKFLVTVVIAIIGAALIVGVVEARPPIVIVHTVPAAPQFVAPTASGLVTIGATGRTVEQPDVILFRGFRLLDQFTQLTK